jgi:hypothetical protein
MQEWEYRPGYIPTSERVMMNLWLQGGKEPTNGVQPEIVIARFFHTK